MLLLLLLLFESQGRGGACPGVPGFPAVVVDVVDAGPAADAGITVVPLVLAEDSHGFGRPSPGEGGVAPAA